MTAETTPTPDLTTDPALAVAERQLVMLRELAELAMGVSRAFAASASEAAKAEKTVLAEDYFTPEVGRARACGAKDAAESFQKVSRAARLTFMLEMTVAETVRDLRAGIIVRSTAAASAPGATAGRLVIGETAAPPAPRLDADGEGDAARIEQPGAEQERRFDIEGFDRLPRGAYVRLVDDLAADVGAAVDWDSATVSAPDLVCNCSARREPWFEPPRHQGHQEVHAEPVPSG